jgi:hypothetical protein
MTVAADVHGNPLEFPQRKEGIVDSQALQEQIQIETEPAVGEGRAALVYAWRLEQLTRAGYSNEYATSLAGDRHIDLHLACDLLGQSCPEQTAYLILS